MTPAQGFGMLGMGLIAIAIGGTIAFWIFNQLEKNKKQDIEKENWEKRFK